MRKNRNNLTEELQKKKKNDLNEVFIKCRDEFNCWQKRCAPYLGLKQCPVCKNVLQSLYSQTMCETNGALLIMILTAKHNANKISKHFFDVEDDISSEGLCSVR